MDGNSSTWLHSLLKNIHILWHFLCLCELRSTPQRRHVGEKKRSHATCQVDVKAAAISDWRTVAWCISSFKCPECVQQSLSDWTHVFHRDESVPFLLVTSASSCPVKVTSDAIARGERLSPLCTHSRLSCDHICGGLCGRAQKWVYDKLKVLRASLVCVSDCICLSQYVNMDIWPKRHGNRPTDQWGGINIQGQSVNGGLLGHFTFTVSLFRCQEEYFPLSPNTHR